MYVLVFLEPRVQRTRAHAPPQVSMNPKNTPFEIKRLLGRRFDDPQLQKDLARLPFKVRVVWTCDVLRVCM